MVSRALNFSLFVVAAAYGQIAQLSAPAQKLNPGQTVIASLALTSGGQSIAAIQVDLQWETAVGLRVAAGKQVGTASKIPYVASLDSQRLRCMIVGINQTALADGELLRLFLSADPGNLGSSTTQVQITNITASDPSGAPVPVNATPIDIQFQDGVSLQSLPADAVLNAASLASAPLSPGEIITLFGMYGSLPVSVQIGGSPAPVLYADTDQINAIVPFGLDPSSPAVLAVSGPSRKVTVTMPVAAVSPAIFTINGGGLGAGAVLNEDYSPNSLDHPALPGSTIMVYGTGFGTLQSQVTDGQIVAVPNPTNIPVTATVGGLAADVLYAGAAPGLVAGVIQINVQLPAGLAHNAIAPLVLHAANSVTTSGVTVAIQ